MGDRTELLAYQRDVLGLTQAQIDQLSVDQIITINGQLLLARQPGNILCCSHQLDIFW